MNATVALASSKIDKGKLHAIVGLFQEDRSAIEKHPYEVPPQYLVGTTRVLNVGFTLTKAIRLVQLDPEWLFCDKLQAQKRINRISQTEETYTYSFICEGSMVETLINERQVQRLYLLNKALDVAHADVEDIVKDASVLEEVVVKSAEDDNDNNGPPEEKYHTI